MLKEEGHQGDLTWGQALRVWWATFWRYVAWGVFPIACLTFLLENVIPGYGRLIGAVLLMGIIIWLIAFVLNCVDFEDFEIRIHQRKE